jgi:ABC-type transport system involved in cytochrome c biogenesis permease subunit
MNATISFFLFLAAAVIEAVIVFRKDGGGKLPLIGRGVALAASLLLLILIFRRSLAIGFPALTGTYEGLIFFAASVGIGTILVRKSAMVRLWGCFVAIALLAAASSPIAPAALSYPVPALRSGWLVFHVAFSFIGEAAFTVAFAAAISWFLMKKSGSREQAERIAAASVAVGYPVYTIGALLFGAIWAQYAWGRFWGWDPKEVWALVTWLVYTFYLHLRLVRRRRGALPMAVLVLGFLIALFTFLGVNLIGSGLHSYS